MDDYFFEKIITHCRKGGRLTRQLSVGPPHNAIAAPTLWLDTLSWGRCTCGIRWTSIAANQG